LKTISSQAKQKSNAKPEAIKIPEGVATAIRSRMEALEGKITETKNNLSSLEKEYEEIANFFKRCRLSKGEGGKQ
jgi:phage-related minor tail protein